MYKYYLFIKTIQGIDYEKADKDKKDEKDIH